MEDAVSVLVLFATVEGQTGKIAKFVSEQVKKAGLDVVMANASDEMATVSYDGVDAVILAAPVHERRHPQPFETLISADRATLDGLRTLLLSVSLNAAFEEGQAEAEDYVVELKMRTGLEPDAQLCVAGAVKTGQYDYFATQIVRHVVMRGRSYDPAAGEHEFTDWDALEKTVAAFLAG